MLRLLLNVFFKSISINSKISLKIDTDEKTSVIIYFRTYVCSFKVLSQLLHIFFGSRSFFQYNLYIPS